MAKIKIFVDTAADMPEKVAEEKGIGIIRFMSVFGETAYVTGTELTNEEFYKKLEEFDGIPTTSQTPYQDMYDTLLKASKENDTVIYFTISSKASGQNNTAKMVVNEILEEDNPDADIRIVDTLRFSAYISMAAWKASELAEQGLDADEIIEKSLEYMNEWKAYMLVDSLKYLEKGGRITKTTAIVGTLLDIKPVLTINDGLVEPLDKLRGKKKLYKKLLELVTENPDFDDEKKEFLVVHSNKEYADSMIEHIKDEFDVDPVYVFEFGPIIGTHAGPGTVAILAREKK